jgi:hypothetical protein
MNDDPIALPMMKGASVWAAVGLTTWSDIAAFAATISGGYGKGTCGRLS